MKQIINNPQEQNQVQQQAQIQQQQQDQRQRFQQFKQINQNKGVCYLSRIPPYMSPNYLRKLLKDYNIERIYLLPENNSLRTHRLKKGGNKKIIYTQGWVQFADKRVAKIAAMSLNCQKMINKKGTFYSEDLWNIKYLPKFKWEHLTARLAYQQRIKKQKLKLQLNQSNKIQEFYEDKVEKGKLINGIIKRKKMQGKTVERTQNQREFKQHQIVEEQSV